MILLQSLKKKSNLIERGFYYFRVIKYMLDISSRESTSFLQPNSFPTRLHIVSFRSLYQIRF